MDKQLEGMRALVVGGGLTPGETIGNGRATAVLFAREGAHVVVADRDLGQAEATVSEILAAGGVANAVQADITDEKSIVHMVDFAREAMGGIDILHNNVGISLAGGDTGVTDIEFEAFERLTRVNLTGMVMTCKHVLPIMCEQKSGVILGIGSIASIIDYPNIAYKTSKAGVVALMENIAIRYAPSGVRANAILPGLMETPMAIESRVGVHGRSREDVIDERNSRVPLLGRMGSAWDVAHAALFLASARARFITGISLPIDGGQALAVG
jgi:NAD(P)-dependent dehydrogenase (short-subunit alcohol dehydrogenase family)